MSCKDDNHDFSEISEGYFKLNGGENLIGKTYDQSVAYATILCRKCGETREIIKRDYRQPHDHPTT